MTYSTRSIIEQMKRTIKVFAVVSAVASILMMAAFAVNTEPSASEPPRFTVQLISGGEVVAELRILQPEQNSSKVRMSGNLEVMTKDTHYRGSVGGEEGARLEIGAAGETPIIVTAEEMKFEHIPTVQEAVN